VQRAGVQVVELAGRSSSAMWRHQIHRLQGACRLLGDDARRASSSRPVSLKAARWLRSVS
jgi:hypothetical protein